MDLLISKKFFKKLFKNRKAVSEVLSAIMMIFMLVGAIAVVWSYLFPTYRNFQTNNALNTVSSYMLQIDDGIYSTFNDGIGSIKSIYIDPFFGYYIYEDGKNVTMRFHDSGTTYDNSFTQEKLGALSYWILNRPGYAIPYNTHKYLKGPASQMDFFINNSISDTYQGLTNLTMTRPETRNFKIELHYRVSLYYWFDQTSDTLSITINLLMLNIKGSSLRINSFQSLNIKFNHTEILFSDTTNVNSDFYIDGSIFTGFSPYQRALNFVKPGTVGNYDVIIMMKASYFTLYL